MSQPLSPPDPYPRHYIKAPESNLNTSQLNFMTRLPRPHRHTPRHPPNMPPRPQTHQPCHTWELRELINQEISNELHSRNQSVLPTMNKSDTVTALVLGLDVQTLSSSSYTEQTRKELIDLAKRAPVLLTYPAGKDRQEALLAIWRLLRQRSQTDNNNDDNNNQNHNKPNNPPPPSLFFETQQPTPFDFSQPPHPHFLTTTVREMHPLPGPRGYVPVSYIDPHVVPLVDYWPGFVREGFRAGSWGGGVEGWGVVVLGGRGK
ncbi:hypothetical protein BDR22DRAFT_818017 [Usnea florida]